MTRRRGYRRSVLLAAALVGGFTHLPVASASEEAWWKRTDPVDTVLKYLDAFSGDERIQETFEVNHRSELGKQVQAALEDTGQREELVKALGATVADRPELAEFMNLALGQEMGLVDPSIVRDWLAVNRSLVEEQLKVSAETQLPVDEKSAAAIGEWERQADSILAAGLEKKGKGEEGSSASEADLGEVEPKAPADGQDGGAAKFDVPATRLDHPLDVDILQKPDPCRPSISSHEYPTGLVHAPVRGTNDAGAQMLSPLPGTMVDAWTQQVHQGSVQLTVDPRTGVKQYIIRGHVQWQPNQAWVGLGWSPIQIFGGDPTPQIWVRPLGQTHWSIYRTAAEDPNDGSVRFSCYQEDAGKKPSDWADPPGAFANPGPSRGYAQLAIPVTEATRPGIEVRVVARTVEYDPTFNRQPGTADPYDAPLIDPSSGSYIENRSARYLNWGSDNATMLVGATPQTVNPFLHLAESRSGAFIDDAAIVDTDGRPNDVESYLKGMINAATGNIAAAISGLKGQGSSKPFFYWKIKKMEMTRTPSIDMSLATAPIRGVPMTNNERVLRLAADLGAYYVRLSYGNYFPYNCMMQTFIEGSASAHTWMSINPSGGMHAGAALEGVNVGTWATFSGPVGPGFGPGAWAFCGALAVVVKAITSNNVWSKINAGMLSSVNPALAAGLETAAIPAPSTTVGSPVVFASGWTNTCELWNGHASASLNTSSDCKGGDVSLTTEGVELGMKHLVGDYYPMTAPARFEKLYRYAGPTAEASVQSHRDPNGVPASFGAVVDEALINSVLRAVSIGDSASTPNGLFDQTIVLGPEATVRTRLTSAPIVAPLPGQTLHETAIIVPDLRVDIDFSGLTYNGNPINHASYSTTLVAKIGLNTSAAGEVRASLSINRPDLLLVDCPLADTGPTFIAWAQGCNYLDFTVFDGTPLPSIDVDAPLLGISFSFNPNAQINELFDDLNTTLNDQMSTPLFTVNTDVGFGVIRNFRFVRRNADLGIYADICAKTGPC